MAKTLFILNDPPFGTERSYHGLRLAARGRDLSCEPRAVPEKDASSAASAGSWDSSCERVWISLWMPFTAVPS